MKKPSQSTISDLLSLGETAFSVLLGASKEMKTHLGGHRESVVRALDLVTRDEFEAVFAMIKKTRQKQDEIDKRLTAIEKKMPMSRPQKKPAKKTNSRKS
jgi:BMFP domain-containing protein YqiC